MSEATGGGLDLCFASVIASGAEEDGAAVGDFSGNHFAGDECGLGGLVGDAILLAAQEDVAWGEADRAGEESAMRVAKGDADARFGTGLHEGGRHADVPPEGDDAVEVMQWDSEFALFFEADIDGLAIFGEPGTFEGDEESVEMVLHRWRRQVVRDRGGETVFTRLGLEDFVKGALVPTAAEVAHGVWEADGK